MTRRLVHLGMALWWAVWSLVIVPAHTRGIISLDGSCPASAALAPLLFGTLPPCCAQHTSNAPTKSPDSSPSDHCAICQLAATTPHSPPVVAVPLYLKLLEQVEAACPTDICQPVLLQTYQSRAPPVV